MENKRCCSFRSDTRLVLEIDELLSEVNDFMWLWYGRSKFIAQKLGITPNYVRSEDKRHIKTLMENMPDIDQLKQVRRLIEAQIQPSFGRQSRMEKLDRAIENVSRGRRVLTELIKRIDSAIVEQSTSSKKPQKKNQTRTPVGRSRRMLKSLLARKPRVSSPRSGIKQQLSKSKEFKSQLSRSGKSEEFKLQPSRSFGKSEEFKIQPSRSFGKSEEFKPQPSRSFGKSEEFKSQPSRSSGKSEERKSLTKENSSLKTVLKQQPPPPSVKPKISNKEDDSKQQLEQFKSAEEKIPIQKSLK